MKSGAERTGKLAFSYINKILVSWHAQGFKTPQPAGGEKRRPNANGPPSEQALDNIIDRFMKE